MNLIFLDETERRQNLLPLTFTRPMADIRVGIDTIRAKWERYLGIGSSSDITEEYLAAKYPYRGGDDADNIFIAGHICPPSDTMLRDDILGLTPGDAIFFGDTMVAFCGSRDDIESKRSARRFDYSGPLTEIVNLYDIFGANGTEIEADFLMVDTSDATPLSPTNRLIGPDTDSEGRPMVYIAPGARVEGATLNTTHGHIYIGPEAEVMEGSCLRGPIAICRHATVNMGTKIYPATTIGPWCKVGGELNNVVMFGYSNKAHDGFLGNAVVGEWCNLGAGCVASNLKNDYSPVRVWNYPAHRFLKTGLQFCGLIMADHSKAGINTMFNTATVVGVGVNVHGSGFPRTFIPSFSEGGASGFSDVPLTKFFDIARRVMARRGRELTDTDIAIFERIYEIADSYK